VGVALCGGLTRVSGSGACMTRDRLGCAEQEERGDVANLIRKGQSCVASVHLRAHNCILAGCQSAAGLVLS